VARDHARREGLDRRAVADVADLGLGAELLRNLAQPLLTACDEYAGPALFAKVARKSGATAQA